MQDHSKTCDCYYCYLKSDEWRREKKRAYKKRGSDKCIICHRKGGEWHHYKGYDFIWTQKDHLHIIPLCRKCHQRCHFRLRDEAKITLKRKQLYRRYLWVKYTHGFRSFRPSTFLNAVFGLS